MNDNYARKVVDALEAMVEIETRILEMWEGVRQRDIRMIGIRERELEIREDELSLNKTRDLLKAKFRIQQIDLAIAETRSAVSEAKEKLKITIDRWDIDRLQPAIHIDEFRLAQMELERKQLLEAYPELAPDTSTND